MAIPSYLHPNPALRWMAWRRLQVIAERLRHACAQENHESELTVLDFGCGTGVLFDEASKYAGRIYGVDLVLEAAQLLVEEWGLSKVTLLTPDQLKKTVPPGSVDIILAAEVLEHIEPLEDTVLLFRDLLKPNGSLLASLPTENSLYRFGRRLAGFHGHYHHLNAEQIDREITQMGFLKDRVQKVPAGGPFAIYWVIDYRGPI
jgi:2-polyprenyl-3-methyl-5-hydroxy-6-metoxy-1,4-benzoquinol methylase